MKKAGPPAKKYLGKLTERKGEDKGERWVMIGKRPEDTGWVKGAALLANATTVLFLKMCVCVSVYEWGWCNF